MKRTQGVLAGMCMVALALGPGIAHAQYQPENTPEACSDRVDNDGDGYVDCYDADCRYLPFCQQQYAPPPPQYAPPPQQYYAPPPPQYYAPPPQMQPPKNGVGEFVVGLIFLPVGLILLGTSVILYDNSGSCGAFASCSSSAGANLAGGIVMDVFGVAMAVMGAIFIPVGIVKMAKFSRWKKEHPGAPVATTVQPTFNAGLNSGTVGLKVTF